MSPQPGERASGDRDAEARRCDPTDGAEALVKAAREALEVAVGLGVLGLMRFRSERPRIEAGFERAGLAPAAVLTRRTGELLDRALQHLMGTLAG